MFWFWTPSTQNGKCKVDANYKPWEEKYTNKKIEIKIKVNYNIIIKIYFKLFIILYNSFWGNILGKLVI